MAKLNRFGKDRAGALREATALFAAAVSLVGVGAAMGLDRLTRDGDLPRIAILPPAGDFARNLPAGSSPERAAEIRLDDRPVGSIRERAALVRLDPCTGSAK